MQITDYSFIFVYLLLGVMVSLVMCRIAIYLGNRFGLIDIPGSLPHKQHKNPTPLVGGIALVGSLLVFIPIVGLYKLPEMVKIFVPLLVIFFFGIWDDKKRIRARYKFLGQAIAAVILVSSGISIQVLESMLGSSSPFLDLAFWVDRLVTIFWIVGITNAFNLVDSMDGLAIGLANMSFAFFMLASINSGQTELVGLFSILFGFGIGILVYNLTPAKLFLGDAGAQTIGFLLAALAILYHPAGKEQASTWFVKVMLMAVPVFDTSLVFFSRLKHGHPFYIAGQDHTYHRLVHMGMPGGRAVAVIQVAAFMINCLAFIAAGFPPLYSNLIFIFTFILGLAAFVFLEKKSPVSDGI